MTTNKSGVAPGRWTSSGLVSVLAVLAALTLANGKTPDKVDQVWIYLGFKFLVCSSYLTFYGSHMEINRPKDSLSYIEKILCCLLIIERDHWKTVYRSPSRFSKRVVKIEDHFDKTFLTKVNFGKYIKSVLNVFQTSK